MKDIRKGNDITIHWAIYTEVEGQRIPYSLDGKDLTLVLGSPYMRKEIKDFIAKGNIITWTYFGKDQKSAGKFSLVLIENNGKEGMHTVDKCNAFRIVNLSCEVGGSDESDVETVTLEFESTIDYSLYEYVATFPQEFSGEQKEQARENIGAISAEYVERVLEELNPDTETFFSEDGMYLDPNGNALKASSQSAVTSYIDLDGVETIKVRGRSGPYVSLLSYYDSNKKFISSLYGNNYNNTIITLSKSDFPANARYFRVTGNADSADLVELASLYNLSQRIVRKNEIGITGVIAMGASLMYSGNGWVEKGCSLIDAIPYNKAKSGEMPPYFAKLIYDGNFCTDEEFEMSDVLAIQFSNAGNVYLEDNSMSVEEYEALIDTSLSNPFSKLSYAQCLDYILKKWQKRCYEQKDNENSKWYGTKFGKPCSLLFVTHWHDARTSYNDSIRMVAEKWGGSVCEFDKKIGFSKGQPLFDGSQMSVAYAVDTENIGGTTFGWHPLRDTDGQYIQKKMANIFANSLKELFSLK